MSGCFVFETRKCLNVCLCVYFWQAREAAELEKKLREARMRAKELDEGVERERQATALATSELEARSELTCYVFLVRSIICATPPPWPLMSQTSTQGLSRTAYCSGSICLPRKVSRFFC